MYTNYFGLQELPFSIAPNPDFMFMSDRHREALTHLTYGLGDTGGFVLLTGEVGTGKTTISRCVLQQLPENTQVAFILNPTLSAQELLATICDELKVRYRKTGATLKTLTDKIQEKLLKNHEAGLNTVLIIDEAQHLQPEVLEQLRLLTNLETNTKKLLQVILIGQPELQQLLQRQDLRQLAQRITARYHLMPLNKAEVVQYIKHRLDVAKSPRMLFNDSAISLIHKLSNGIPRLINLLCDRSLLRAYSSNQTLVNKKIVMSASYEALGKEKDTPKWSQVGVLKLVLIVSFFVSCLVGGALFLGFWFANNNAPIHTAVNSPANNTELQTSNLEVINSSSTNANQLSPNLESRPNVENTSNENNVSVQVVPPSVESEQSVNVFSAKEKNYANNQILNIEQTSIAQNDQNFQENTTSKPKTLREPQTKVINGKPRPLPEFKVEAQDGVSDELLTLFQTAIEETERLKEEDLSEPKVENSAGQSNIRPLTDMPNWVQNGVPKLDFQMHLYESNNSGSVKVNGEEKFAGELITRDVVLIAIERQRVILSYQGQEFSLPSLSSWE